VGLLLGLFREHKLNQEGPEESRISSFRAPIAVLVLYLLCTWTLKELGVHALFSPVSYLIAVCGTTFGLWIIGTRRVLNGRRKRTALSVVALLFWIGLPLVLKFSEAGFQAYLRNAPIEFIYEYPGVVLQSRIVTAPTASSPGLRVSEMVPLAGDRQLMLTEHHLPDAPPYKAILPVFLMSASFLWRRRNA
jgi:hypothetical protein